MGLRHPVVVRQHHFGDIVRHFSMHELYYIIDAHSRWAPLYSLTYVKCVVRPELWSVGCRRTPKYFVFKKRMCKQVCVCVCVCVRGSWSVGRRRKNERFFFSNMNVSVSMRVFMRGSWSVGHRSHAIMLDGSNGKTYGVATISRLLKITGLFCRIQTLLQGSFAKETDNFKEPTNRSHPISSTGWRRPIGCLKLQVIFCQTATNCRAFWRKKTNKDKASYGSSPLCSWIRLVGSLKLSVSFEKEPYKRDHILQC